MTASRTHTLITPIPVRVHPQADLLDRRTSDWARAHRLGLTEQGPDYLARVGSGHMAARVFPHAATDHAQTGSDYLGFMFALDDVADILGPRDIGAYAARAARLQRLVDAPGSPPLDDDPYAGALADLLDRLARIATPGQLYRLAVGFRAFLFGALWQASSHLDGSALDLNQYTALRIPSFGLRSLLPVLEIVHRYHPDDEELAAPAVRALTEMAGFIGSCDNDIYSWAKDSAVGAAHVNLVGVLSRGSGDDGLAQHEALVEAVALRNHVMALFVRRCAEVSRDASAGLRYYLRDLGGFVAGWSEFHRISRRFQQPGKAQLVTAAAPPPTTAAPDASIPLPIPTIAWWWAS